MKGVAGSTTGVACELDTTVKMSNDETEHNGIP